MYRLCQNLSASLMWKNKTKQQKHAGLHPSDNFHQRKSCCQQGGENGQIPVWDLTTYLGGNFQLKADTWNTTPTFESLTHIYLEDQPKVCSLRTTAEAEQQLMGEEWGRQEDVAQHLFRVWVETRRKMWSGPLRGHSYRNMYAMALTYVMLGLQLLCRFWYWAPLMSKDCKALRTVSGSLVSCNTHAHQIWILFAHQLPFHPDNKALTNPPNRLSLNHSTTQLLMDLTWSLPTELQPFILTRD